MSAGAIGALERAAVTCRKVARWTGSELVQNVKMSDAATLCELAEALKMLQPSGMAAMFRRHDFPIWADRMDVLARLLESEEDS